jgi:putative redox protein
MVKMTALYQGEKHCEATHLSSGVKIETDAPKDNQGRGESFSPTDLVATALGTCALTTIAIQLEKEGLDLSGAKMTVEKEMVSNPRRISSLKTIIELSASTPQSLRQRIYEIANNCPVKKSIHPDIQAQIEIIYV